ASSQPTDGNGDVVWQAAGIYNGGDQVTHQGNKYEAKWWTQGDEPGVADVWKAL
ncbi:carbohydrate-binding protein, partial [Pseudoalteromonas sp.]